MTVYGYARVSSKEQNLARQLTQLKEFGCEKIYEEKLSGEHTDNRPQLNDMLENLQEGDTVIVTDLTRITRSTQDLFNLVQIIKDKGAGLQSIKDTWLNTSDDNPYSEFLLTVMAGVNQLERKLIKMRQREGIALAKERGVYKGRPKKYTEKNKGLQHALELFNDRDNNGMTVKEICEITKISKATLYREAKERS
ncbi:recombinase family protein [Neobacillus sp. NRS-1170]|uniref:recombinase family protein n=1 Tax=Neobacillus sp. NRS-1170 TaxID=3233898 RepID=UPI003D2B7C3C